MSAILRWWARHDRAAAPRVLGALLVVALLAATGIGALAPPPFSQAAALSLAGPVSPEPSPASPRDAPTPRGAVPTPSPPPIWRLVEPAGDFVGWAIVEYGSTGVARITSSDNAAELSTTASMIKAWIAADYLRRTAEAGRQPSPTRLAELTAVIRDSHNAYADAIFRELGADESIERLIDICDLPYARAVPDRWSNTLLSPVDTALLGLCIADGRAAGPGWTDWLLNEMRLVRGLGDFGIRDAVAPAQRSSVAIKNGWVERHSQGAWHVNCLAIGDSWTMGVMTRYPARLGYEHGAELCRSLAADHLPTLADQGPIQPNLPESDLN